jgi:excisionase family DNA binding protein
VKCPDCGSATVVDHIRPLADGTISRLRGCPQCRNQFRTSEVLAPLNSAALPTEPTLTLRGAATILGVSPSTVQRYVKSGTIPSLRIGSRWVIRQADVERLTRHSVTVSHRTRVKPAALHPSAV